MPRIRKVKVIEPQIQFTAECAHEAIILRAYCESRWPIGLESRRYFSCTGEPYIVLQGGGYNSSAESARMAAQKAFDKYAEGKSGTLYWRVVPEIGMHRNGYYVYYLRLLISEKPPIQETRTNGTT